MNWYVIKVANGKEKKVIEAIEAELNRHPIENLISKLIAPSKKTQQIRNGKKINVEKITIPGYIFVECESIDDVEGYVKYIGGVQSIIKKSLRQSEINRLLETPVEVEEIHTELYYVNERVKIIDGPFNTFFGVIKTVDMTKQKSKIVVNVFEREVILDLVFGQFVKNEKIN